MRVSLFLVVVFSACMPVDNFDDRGNGGTQIGSLDCGQDLIEIRMRDQENTALQGHIVYTYEDEQSVDLPCLYKCNIPEPGMGSYEIIGTVGEVSITEIVAFEPDEKNAATKDCPSWYEKIVRLEFTES